MELRQKEKAVQAPGLDSARVWLNVARPLSLAELKGAVVLLDFWTYCCINCMHVLPTLRELEHRHKNDPLVVIGVHSGKFSAERDPSRIREAIGRYGVEHPVAVDEDMAIWSQYRIRSWPTLVVIKPDGTIAAVAPGEPELETLDDFVTKLLDEARDAGTLAPAPPLIEHAPPLDHDPLCYPGKAAVLPDGRIAVSDSGHHRVLLCDRSGEVQLSAGSGLRGYVDGPTSHAAFDDPQGLCWHGGALYVADTRNHCIRKIDVADKVVSTVAGTGELGVAAPAGRAPARDLALRSPWDLCAVGDAIYVAMAGSHQLWRYWPKTEEIELYAGSGVEALIDGPCDKSAWAQPSGLSERAGTLYVADSETSAVRAVDLQMDEVRTLTGQGLFDFGDGEGDAGAAVLQHCLGVAAVEDGVLIADTYNGKIKRWRPREGDEYGEIETVLSDLHEPGSVAVAPDGAWIIADTNAHRLLAVVDGTTETIELRGAPPPQRGALAPTTVAVGAPVSTHGWFTTLLQLPGGVGLKPGDGGLSLILRTPPGTDLAPGSPFTVRTEVSRRSDLLLVERPNFSIESEGGSSQIVGIAVRVEPFAEPSIEAELVATIEYVVCREDDVAACHPARLHVRVPVRLLTEGGTRQLEFGINLASMDD